MTEQKKEIKINDKTRDMLIEMERNVQMIRSNMQAVVSAYIDATGAEGEYQLSADMSKLVLK